MDGEVRSLLVKVLTDPGYRSRLDNDPVNALGEVSITVDPPPAAHSITLPSDAEILALFVLDPNWDAVQQCQCVQHVIHWPV